MLLSLGFLESTVAIAMAVVGASDAAGKLLLAGIADRLAFPKLFLFHVACFSGIGVMLSMLWVESVAAVYCVSACKS